MNNYRYDHRFYNPVMNIIMDEVDIREPSVKIEKEVEEAALPVNVSQNWKDIPKYGHYNDILNYEDIIKPGDLLKGIDTSAPAPKAESNVIDPDNGTKNNRWLPPDWNKN